VHRDVLDALIPTLPLCDSKERSAHWPIFNMKLIHENDEWRSMGEDYGFDEMVGDLGFTVWLDPTVMINHFNGNIAVNYMNMEQIHAATKSAGAV
jgi:hypothetical protein